MVSSEEEKFIPKSEETLESQKVLFLNVVNARELGIEPNELEQINELDVIGCSTSEVKNALQNVLGDSGRVEKIWSGYIDFLRNKEKILIKDLLNHRDLSGPLVNYMDWDYISEKLHKGPDIKLVKKGETVLDQSNAGSDFYVILNGEVKYEKRDIDGKVIKENINKPYEYFGEQAILNNKITDSTNTVASEKAILLRIDQQVFIEALERVKNNYLADQLKNTETKFSEDILPEILKNSRINTYRKYQSITTQNQEQTKFNILLSGSAFVLRDSRHITDIHPGNFIGDVELFEEGRKNIASVFANQDCVVLEIDIDGLGKLLREHKAFKLLLSEKARVKDLEGQITKKDADPYGIYNYHFLELDNMPESEKIKKDILQVARETITRTIKSNQEGCDDKSIEELFNFICKSLEQQELDSPKYYVSHGTKHSINVMNFAEAALDGSPTLQKNMEKIFGQNNGKILLRLAALFHDIGYPELNRKNEKRKWKHQEYSAKLVHLRLPYEKLSKVLNITPEQYKLFIESIEHHGSDNPNKLDEGRPFVCTTNEENPLLVIMRIADNLDLISERLSKLQRDEDFQDIIKKIYNKCSNINEVDKREKRIQKMHDILEKKLKSLNVKNDDDEKRINEITDNIKKMIELDDWEAHLHFGSIAIAQNVFIREETKKFDSGQENINLVIYVEYNKPATKLPLSLINWQTGRLEESVNNSLALKTEEGKSINIKIKRIFPTPGSVER